MLLPDHAKTRESGPRVKRRQFWTALLGPDCKGCARLLKYSFVVFDQLTESTIPIRTIGSAVICQ